MSLSTEQLEARRAGIGGSDVAAIIGIDPYRTIWDVWESKVLPPKPQSENGDILRGNLGEPVAAGEYARRYGQEIILAPEDMVHPDYPWMRGNPDRLIVTDTTIFPPRGAAVVPLEIKCPRIQAFYSMKAEGLREQYVLQLQHYMAVGGWDKGVFALWCGEYSDLYAFQMARDEEITAYLIETERRFWEEYVLPKKQPPAPLPEPTRYPRAPGEAQVREDAAWREKAEAYVHFHYEALEATTFLAEAEAKLLEALEENDTNVSGAGVVVKRYATTSQRRWNSKRFLASYKLWRAGENGDTPPDPDDDDFYTQTQPSDKTDVKVLAPEEVLQDA